MTVPVYWMNDTGDLRAAMEAYLDGEDLSEAAVTLIRAYFRQWIAEEFIGDIGVDNLRRMVDRITDRKTIATWLELAQSEAIDPL